MNKEIILVPIKTQGRVIYIPRADENTLGIVKPGEGIDIDAEGVITLADHTHEIPEILELDNTLNNKMRSSKVRRIS